MTDHEHELATDAAHTAMAEAIAAYTPTAMKELTERALKHIQDCWGDNEVAHKIWDEAFAAAERKFAKMEESADRE
jgi:hypothetical protein